MLQMAKRSTTLMLSNSGVAKSSHKLSHNFSECSSSTRARKSTHVSTMAGGKFHHFGLEAGLRQALQSCKELPTELVINVNVDGLPISKSSKGHFWLILGLVKNLKGAAPFVIRAFFSDSKPTDANKFMRKFVEELNALGTSGIVVGTARIPVRLNALVCDAPAKAFVLCIKQHTGYYSCSKCTIKGRYRKKRVCFPGTKCALRTDRSVRRKTQWQHHTGRSILAALPIDLVKDVPLDYMHLVCLGVVHKLIVLWFHGPKKVRLGRKVRLALSKRNVALAQFVPFEFNRKPRSLAELDRWKATEFRFFLLYGGPVLLSSLLPDHMFQHFLMLHVAITLLSMPSVTPSEVQYAGQLLDIFVLRFAAIYGQHHVSHNVHGLSHLAADVEHLGPLDSWSAFPFENYMSTLKKMVRKPEFPLEQLCNRLAEQAPLFEKAVKVDDRPLFSGPHNRGPLIGPCQGQQFQKVKLPGNVVFDAGKKNSCCVLADGSVVVIENIAHLPSKAPCIIGRKFLQRKDLYSSPCPSSMLGIHVVSQLSNLRFWPLESVEQKCVKLAFKRETVVFPLLHTR
ncbi:uncharacterized protein LOC144153059 [Haemaphysalis longicornis]